MSVSKRSFFGLVGMVGMGGAAAYRLRRKLWQRILALPPSLNDVHRQENVRVVMPDGVSLATDIYQPSNGGRNPTILARTPYGRSNLLVNISFQRLAERGYNVVSQDCRGRFDSEGVFEPYVHEAGDGRATIEWIVQQPWSDGQVGMWGRSYVGYVQWAAATTGSPHLKAMVPCTTMAHLGYDPVTGINLDRTLRWLYILDALQDSERPRWENLLRLFSTRTQDRVVAQGYYHLPISTADEAMLGYAEPILRTWLEHIEANDAYWQAIDHRPRVKDITIPTHHLAGWYDIFLDGQLADYAAMRAAGQNPYLTIGPWTHLDRAVQWESLRVGLEWFDAHLKERRERLRASPVRVYVMGADEWRDYESWPPAAEITTYYLHEGGRLALDEPPSISQPDRYDYDPADPTPNIGGALLSSRAGSYDNREVEARDDVLTYTTEPLTGPLEIIGPLQLRLYVHSNREHTDFFGRLCDVRPDGQSMNISDGFIRLAPGTNKGLENGSLCLEISLSPTAYRFLPGHRLRLQIASSAHPRIARNLGSGESPIFGTTLVTAEQTVFHDATRPSALILPVT